jgi:hypothetical protein
LALSVRTATAKPTLAEFGGMRLWVRAVLAVGLVAVLCLGFVDYAATAPTASPYPESEALATDYDAHVGEEALLFGTVQAVENGTLVIEIGSEAGPVTMTVPGADVAVEPGGFVQVYGTLASDHTITPERTVVVNADGGSGVYKYVVSAVGGLVVLGLFGRYWTVDTDAWALEVRGDG